MGGKHSARSILITTDQASFRSGATITGKIYMKLEKAVNASTLWIKFKGKEQVWWDPGALSSKSKGVSYLLNLKAPVMIWEDGVIPSGDYEIPYTYVLPDHLVNSYHLETINYGADITYKLKAELEPEKHKKIKNTVAIDICNPVEEINADIVTSKNVAVGHCCSTKSFRINVQLDKSCYSPLDNPDIIMEINNKSSHANIDVIKISLSRMIFLTSNKNQKTIFSQYIGQHKVKGCQKGKICEKDSALMTTLQLAKYQKIIHNTPTIKSNKVECKYSLIFEFESFDCCVKNIDEFEIPIRFSSQIIEIIRPQPAVPSLWNPVTYDVQYLSYTNAEAYAPSAPPLEDE